MSAGGSSYVESGVSKSCSGRLVTVSGVMTGEIGIGTVNSSSSSSTGSFQAATIGVSKGGVSVISKSSTLMGLSGRFDHNQLALDVKRSRTCETGVAVTTNKPKMNTSTNTGSVSYTHLTLPTSDLV